MFCVVLASVVEFIRIQGDDKQLFWLCVCERGCECNGILCYSGLCLEGVRT